MKTLLVLLMLTVLGCDGFVPRGKYHKDAQHNVLMFWDGGVQCNADWFKIKLSGNAGRIERVNLGSKMAKLYRVTAAPTYVILEWQDQEWTEVYRTRELRELDRVTKGKR